MLHGCAPRARNKPRPGRAANRRQKKAPAFGRGWEAFLLSHIKAPAQGGKAGGGKPPEP
jgi:hypothetical protein